MCLYCENLKSLYYNKNYWESSLKEVYIEPDGTLTISFWSADDEDSINLLIEYCPKCGRKLNVKEDNMLQFTENQIGMIYDGLRCLKETREDDVKSCKRVLNIILEEQAKSDDIRKPRYDESIAETKNDIEVIEVHISKIQDLINDIIVYYHP